MIHSNSQKFGNLSYTYELESNPKLIDLEIDRDRTRNLHLNYECKYKQAYAGRKNLMLTNPSLVSTKNSFENYSNSGFYQNYLNRKLNLSPSMSKSQKDINSNSSYFHYDYTNTEPNKFERNSSPENEILKDANRKYQFNANEYGTNPSSNTCGFRTSDLCYSDSKLSPSKMKNESDIISHSNNLPKNEEGKSQNINAQNINIQQVYVLIKGIKCEFLIKQERN